MVQQLRLHVSTAAGPTPGWGTKVPHAVQWGHQNTHTHTHVYIKGILLIVSTFSLSLCLATLSTEPLIFPTSSVRFSCPVVSDSP